MHCCYATSSPVRLNHRKIRSIHSSMLCHEQPCAGNPSQLPINSCIACYATSSPVRLSHCKFPPIHVSLLCHKQPGATHPSQIPINSCIAVMPRLANSCIAVMPRAPRCDSTIRPIHAYTQHDPLSFKIACHKSHMFIPQNAIRWLIYQIEHLRKH